jgi:hypothetical protein
MRARDKVFIFWGSMDALAVVLYCAQSVRHDRIPFIADMLSFSTAVDTFSAGGYNALLILFFCLDLMLLLSFFASAWCFITRRPFASKLALCQEVLRLVSFRCSVALFPLFLAIAGESSVWLSSILFSVSECLKIYSLWVYKYEKVASPA